MKPIIIFFVVLIGMSCFVVADVWSYLTMSQGDNRYCKRDGLNCNLTVNGTLTNFTPDTNFTYTATTGFFSFTPNFLNWLYSLFYTQAETDVFVVNERTQRVNNDTSIINRFSNRLNYSKETKENEVWLKIFT